MSTGDNGDGNDAALVTITFHNRERAAGHGSIPFETKEEYLFYITCAVEVEHQHRKYLKPPPGREQAATKDSDQSPAVTITFHHGAKAGTIPFRLEEEYMLYISCIVDVEERRQAHVQAQLTEMRTMGYAPGARQDITSVENNEHAASASLPVMDQHSCRPCIPGAESAPFKLPEIDEKSA